MTCGGLHVGMRADSRPVFHVVARRIIILNTRVRRGTQGYGQLATAVGTRSDLYTPYRHLRWSGAGEVPRDLSRGPSIGVGQAGASELLSGSHRSGNTVLVREVTVIDWKSGKSTSVAKKKKSLFLFRKFTKE